MRILAPQNIRILRVTHMPDETPLFIGEYEDIPVDNKGRLIVPAAIRRVLPTHVTSLVIARWFDGCLAGFDPIGWQQVLQQIREGNHKGKVKRQIARWVMGGAAEARIDRQGRLLVPRKLLDMSEITDRATLSGVGNRIEIWNPARYSADMSDVGQNLEEFAEDLDIL